MSEIKGLPSRPFWSLIRKKDQFFLLSEPKTLKKVYIDRVEDLLTGKHDSCSGQVFLENFINDHGLDQLREGDKWLIHLFYEAGHLWNYSGFNHEIKIGSDQLLALVVEYQEETPFDPNMLRNGELDISWERPSKEAYKRAYEKGKEHLKQGDCYQYNLTFPFEGKIEKGDLETLVHRLWGKNENRGEFAHLTFLDQEFYVSNTPECLFDWRLAETRDEKAFSYLESRPIKGTISTTNKKDDVEEKWQSLKSNDKNESELYMITDLIRNDLNRIENPLVEVLEKKALLEVPGLVHSYSHLKVPLSEKVSALDIVKSLFPGGSITGAPKIRVMEIIHDIESVPRGFYCGSTLIPSDNSIVATINIRSAHGSMERKCLTYHAGGGVTWDSSLEGEFSEMDNKFLSFSSLLTLSLN